MNSLTKKLFNPGRYALIIPIMLAVISTACGETRQGDTEVDAPVTYVDSAITNAVNADLIMARGVSPANLSVTTGEGVVTLKGTVSNLLAKARAERIALSTKGVRSVVNLIRVETDRKDAAVAEDVREALNSDPVTDTWEIDSSVENNVVTLDGAVDSWLEKQLVAKVVKGVRGVRDIKNGITVDMATERTDQDIRENVQQALKWDSRIDDLLIDVSVEDDKVTLSGSVGSAYEKQLAVEAAHTLGVKSVNAEDLQIKPWARDQMQRTEADLDLTEVQKEDAIRDALQRDPRVSSFELDVEIEEGIASLTGTVDNLKAKRAAARVAQNTIGVWMIDQDIGIENKIVVKPEDSPDAETIRKRINRAIERDPYVEAVDVSVSVDQGTVTLTGNAESYFEKYQTGDIASRISGVTDVDNDLKVEYDPFAFDKESYDWDPVVDDIDFMLVSKTDEELEEDVTDHIRWSPFVESSQVEVSVNNGVVTLTGKVDSSLEYNEATEEAYEAGALKVNNKLKYNEIG